MTQPASKDKVYIVVICGEGGRHIVAVKATKEDAEKAERRFAELHDTDIEEWTIGEEYSEPPEQLF